VAFADTTTAVPETVAPFAGAVIETTGGVVSGVPLFTVTVTAALVVLLFEVSLAIACNVCEPFAVFVESHDIVYGEAVSKTPTFTPSNWNCTLATATLSVAFADTTTAVPETVAALAGAVIDTVGGIVSGAPLFTVTATAALVVLLLDVSFAIARKLCEPLTVFVESHAVM
jgi:hypothetical protein